MGKRPWTTGELSYLRDSAGSLPLAAIAAALGRTPDAVQRMASRWRVSVRYRPRRMEICPMCGRRFDPYTGPRSAQPREMCAVCRWERAEADAEAGAARWLALCPPEHRANVATSERWRHSSPNAAPRPVPPDTSRMSNQQRNAALDAYDSECEQWAAVAAKRRAKAAQKRKERNKWAAINAAFGLPTDWGIHPERGKHG